MPTSRGKNQLDAASGTIPRRAKTKPKRAVSLARRKSIGSCMVAPMPTAAPLIAPMTGFLHWKIRKVSRPPESRTRSSDRLSTAEPLAKDVAAVAGCQICSGTKCAFTRSR